MAMQYSTVPENDLGGGIDKQSPENKIPPGYAESLVNVDPRATGQVGTRKGYQGYAGNVPARVTKITQTGTDLCFSLDPSIDLSNVRSSPIYVRGRTSDSNTSNDGDFVQSVDTSRYYSAFSLDTKKTISIGAGNLVITQSEHGFTTEFLAVQVTESTSQIDTSNSHITLGAVSIDKTTKDITIPYTNNTTSVIEVFVQIESLAVETGVSYISSGNSATVGNSSFTIPAATHNLNSFQILTWAYVDDGVSLTRFDTSSTIISPTGDITFEQDNDTGSPFSATYIMRAVTPTNIITGSVAGNTTTTINVPNFSDSFAFFSVYLETTIGGDLEEVYAGDISIDTSTDIATVSFTNGTSTGKNFELYYLPTSLITNRVCVTADTAVTTPYIDLNPQMVIWGFFHSELYGNDREVREGWVNHIDSYQSAGENRLICGLGGTLYSAQTKLEQPSDLLQYFPALSARVSTDTVIAPVFTDVGSGSTRTRGHIESTGASSGFVRIESATYSSGTGRTTYRFLLPGKVVDGTLSTIISTVDGLRDQVLVQQMGYSRLNGTFDVVAVTEGADYLDIEVDNPEITLSDYDETNAGGRGGVFTDQLPLTAATPFLDGDTLSSDLFSNQQVVSGLGSIVVIEDVIDLLSIPSGLRLAASRITNVIPLKDSSNTLSVDNLVRGDMLSYTEISRLLRVLYVNPEDDISITITSDGAEATVVLGSENTSGLSIGQTVLILGTINYNGAQVITEIPSLTSFKFDTTLTVSDTGTLVGKTATLDETLEIINLSSFSVEERWYPIEAPEDSFNLTPKTAIQTFDSSAYGEQEVLRSTMVQDNLYFTNGNDEVMKFDGISVYRAGLFRWQPNLFVSTDTTATGAIVLNNQSITVTGASANIFTVTLGDELAFVSGDQIKHSTDPTIVYTVTGISDDGTDGKITVNRTVAGAGSGTIALIVEYKYYFRLNTVDINENIIASALTGADDMVVQLTEDSAVRIRMVGMPVFGNYDYGRLEVQIYRTKGNTVGPFYLLTTLPMDFDTGGGYLDYLDTDSDEDLIQLDSVNSALFGSELTGNGISEPLRASCITSAENRLLLSNIKDYPSLDTKLVPNSTGAITIPNLIAPANSRYLFRRDNTDPLTTTDMTNRAAYEFIDNSNTTSIVAITAPDSNTININTTLAHGLTVGDWVYMYHPTVADGNLLTYAGWFQISAVPDVSNFRFPYKGAAAGVAGDVTNYVTATVPSDIPILLGTDGNYNVENGNRDITLIPGYEFLAMRRMANGINCSMRNSNTSGFSPWLVARAGNEFDSGQLIIKQPLVEDRTIELQLPALDGTFDIFVNDFRRTSSSSAGALTRVFPSRTLASFPNFPEMFDRPTAQLDIDSQSAIDVNPADGQEITSTIPFFGDSAFQGATKGAIVVVFKTNSIYLVNVANKASGLEPTQKLESDGKGCTAPYSVAVTRGGIMFANLSGIYRLERNLSITYIGQKLERIWKQELNRSELPIATGHYFATENQYKLSFPSGLAQTENNEVLVYNSVREYSQQSPQAFGSWTTYTQHPVTGWANLQDNAYFGNTVGQVLSVRNNNDVTDYRDDYSSIPVQILTRAMDFGNSGIRKAIGSVVTHYRTLITTDNLTLRSGIDLANTLELTETFKIDANRISDNLSDTINKSIVTVRSALAKRIGNYLQLSYTIDQKDQPIEIAGIDIRVGAKSDKGIPEATDTNR